MEIKEKQDSDPIMLEIKGAFHNQRVEVFSRGEKVYYATMVDFVFLMWAS